MPGMTPSGYACCPISGATAMGRFLSKQRIVAQRCAMSIAPGADALAGALYFAVLPDDLTCVTRSGLARSTWPSTLSAALAASLDLNWNMTAKLVISKLISPHVSQARLQPRCARVAGQGKDELSSAGNYENEKFGYTKHHVDIAPLARPARWQICMPILLRDTQLKVFTRCDRSRLSVSNVEVQNLVSDKNNRSCFRRLF